MVVFGCTPTAEAPPDDATTSEGMVVWITDGDTIQVVVSDQEVEVRLAGINAPEREECFYGPALDHLIDTLRDKAVTMEIVGDDQFGRTLAHVFEGERYVNEEMVTSGLAIATTDDGDPRSPALLAAEERAAANGVGLWEPEACGPVDESRSVEIDGSVSVTDPPGPDEETLGEDHVDARRRGVEQGGLGGVGLGLFQGRLDLDHLVIDPPHQENQDGEQDGHRHDNGQPGPVGDGPKGLLRFGES